MKLDRLLAKHESMGRNRARARILGGRVRVDGGVARQFDHEVDRFMKVELDDVVIQAAERLLYVMLYKPTGVVSATVDPEHPTVIDLIDDPDRGSLHLVGRLDRNTSGLVLLTNDGRWSKALMDPAKKVPKVYRVQTRDPIPAEAVAAFAEGFYFHTEDLVTRPAKLEIIGEREARLTLHEGRYHQIKRMFHRVGNLVTGLHREQIGELALPDDLESGQWRLLSKEEAGRCRGEAATGPC
ncbi:pseudouridine synthase [Luteolibacter flavescens]|uniref:Pseudouridine synthase n=1 Tax=Luteolibacter flavescens TaxID=1859460 RepID=A0ABT3FK56_9BACT|nr:pseudouridine synthase [Luteolibacter flavescens]MCW1883739.1 pseudouridine synthase [Luteolibacter flavescens]